MKKCLIVALMAFAGIASAALPKMCAPTGDALDMLDDNGFKVVFVGQESDQMHTSVWVNPEGAWVMINGDEKTQCVISRGTKYIK